MGVGVVGMGIASLVGVGVIGIIGLRLAVHRHQVHTPALSGPCSFLTPPVRPSGAPLKLRRLSWYLSAVRLPQSGPCSIPATALPLRSFLPLLACSRGRYAGPPPWGAARLATLGCTRVMAFVPPPQGLMHKQRPRHGFAWYGLVPSCSFLTFPAPALGWHGAFGGGGPFHDVAGPGFDWAEVQDMKPG